MSVARHRVSLALAIAARFKQSTLWVGLLLVALLAALAVLAADAGWARHSGLSALTLAILAGILVGDTCFSSIATYSAAGVDFAKSWLLRLGVILYGFQITFQQIGAVGWRGVLIAAVMLTVTFLLALQLGTRLFKLDRQSAILIGAGSAICGAAAVVATEPVVGGEPYKAAVAVATVVVFGTLGMFVYPLLYPHLGLSPQRYGIYAGSTIHEVAQVMVAARSVSESAASTAVIEKMLRVMMLAPFLLVLSAGGSPRGEAGAGEHRPRLVIPWFALLFIAASALNSLHWLSAGPRTELVRFDTVLLAMAMAALGLRTHISAVRQAGFRPLLLALTLWVFLIVGGYAINRLILAAMS